MLGIYILKKEAFISWTVELNIEGILIASRIY